MCLCVYVLLTFNGSAQNSELLNGREITTFRASLVLLTVLLRLNNACGEQDFHLFYQVFHPWLRLVLVPETPCNSISSQYHAVTPLKHTYGMHIAQVHTNLMNSRTSTITHFVEHSTRLYDCKSYILDSIYKLVTENDFVFIHINYHLFSCRWLNDNELKTLPSGIFSNLSSLWVL